MIFGVDFVLWLALTVALACGYYAFRVALRWRSWQIFLLALAVGSIATGPALEILGNAQLIDAALTHRLIEYRWAAVAILGLAAIITVARLIERERHAMAELTATEQRFRSISAVLPVGVFQADLDGRCIYANEVALNMIGIRLGDAIGEGWIRRLHPHDRDRVMEEWQAAAIEGRDFRAEYRFRTDKGDTIWVLGHVLAMKDGDGDVVGHVGAITDITGRKRNEIALQQARETLEHRVADRTAELTQANRELERQMESRQRAEAATAESEARLRAILDNTPAHIFIKDLAGRYLYVNRPHFLAGSLLAPDEMVGRSDDALFPPDVAKELQAADQEVIDSNAPIETETQVPTASGLRTFFSIRFPLKAADGAIYALAGVATDITRRTTVNEAVRQVFDLSPVGMCSFSNEGRFGLVNESFARLLGVTPADLIGHSVQDVLHPDDLAAAIEAGAGLREDSRNLIVYENRYRHASGEYRTLSWHATYSPDDEAFFAAATDITDVLRKDDSIRKIYRLSPLMMCTLSFDGVLLVVNPVFPRTLGYTEEEVVGHHYREFVHPDDLVATQRKEEELKAKETTVTSYEVRLRCKDGSYRLTSWDVSSSFSDSASYGVARDVTDARQIELQISERRDEMAHLVRLQTMGEMAAEIAHELNQPLGAIVNYARGAANRVRDHVVTETELLSLLEKIAGQALRGGDLIRRVRTFVKKAEIEVTESDLNKLVRDAVGLLSVSGRHAVPIRLDLSNRLPEIHVDGVQIEQVIVNLVRNAIDAVGARENGELVITTSHNGSREIRLSVSDNGPGLAPHDADKIFEAFYTTKPGGLGLGLPISRSIVQAHGGRLWVESSPQGGATFHLSLPVAARAAA